MKPLNRHAAKRAWKTFDLCIRAMRDRARELGYALAVHGSIARDIDIIAIPWTHDAVPDHELVVEMLHVIIVTHGRTTDDPGCIHMTSPVNKPHGRCAWEIHVWGTYFDFGVMPRLVAGTPLT